MKKRMAKAKGPKVVPYALTPQQTDIGRPMYELLYAIIDEHHQELSQSDVKIALAWALAWKPDTDGRLTLGKCKKATDLDRELAPYDFVILLNRDFWTNPRVTAVQRRALVDHELMHAALAYDQDGHPKRDERGRHIYRLRKHDLEEFRDIVARYGCYKDDIEAFMAALVRAERSASGWIGFSSVHEALAAVGVEVAVDVIATWPESSRREVLTWALLRQEGDVKTANVAMSPTAPACLVEALGLPKHPPTEVTAH
jgi:hypothetical protein